MRAAVPVAAADAGDWDPLGRDGETGRLVDVDDPDAWANAIVDLLKNPQLASAMGRPRPRGDSVNSMTSEVAARRREAGYRQAIDAHGRRRGARAAH